MPTESPSLLVLIYTAILLVAGLGCCFHFLFLHSSRKIGPDTGRAPAWTLPLSDFLAGFAAIVLIALFVTVALRAIAAERVDERAFALMAAGGAQLGALGGLLFFLRAAPAKFTSPFNSRPMGWWEALKISLYTFLAFLPVLWLLALAWRGIITWLDLPAHHQDPVTWFAEADSIAILAAMIFLTVLVAPLAEEFLFRGCLYRFLKARMSIALAIGVNGIIFAALHFNWLSLVPLLFLGMVMAYAYERTGNLKVPILIHGIFNTNTVVLILLTVHLA